MARSRRRVRGVRCAHRRDRVRARTSPRSSERSPPASPRRCWPASCCRCAPRPVTALAHHPLSVAPVLVVWLVLSRLAPRWSVPSAFVVAAVVVVVDLVRSGTSVDATDLVPRLEWTTPHLTLAAVTGVALPLFVARRWPPRTSPGSRSCRRSAIACRGVRRWRDRAATVVGSAVGVHALKLSPPSPPPSQRDPTSTPTGRGDGWRRDSGVGVPRPWVPCRPPRRRSSRWLRTRDPGGGGGALFGTLGRLPRRRRGGGLGRGACSPARDDRRARRVRHRGVGTTFLGWKAPSGRSSSGSGSMGCVTSARGRTRPRVDPSRRMRAAAPSSDAAIELSRTDGSLRGVGLTGRQCEFGDQQD